MPTFAEPIALFGLTALVPLTVLYLLFRRPRVRDVSSLLLWEGLARRRTGGARLDRLRTPLSYLLECLCVVLLTLAAAAPLIVFGSLRRPLVVVLDNSLSMTARGPDATSVQETAEQALRQVLRSEPSARYVLAGARPRALPGIGAGLPAWTPSEPSADLASACALARDLGGARARILVLTDRAPEDLLPPEVRWLAFGQQIENTGIVNAVRDRESLLVEVRNFGVQPAERAMSITIGESLTDPATLNAPGDPRVHAERLALAAGAHRSVRIALKAPGRVVTVALESDGLSFDDRVVLAPIDRPPLRASVRCVSVPVAAALERAIEASELARLDHLDPQIEFTDGPALATPTRWIVQFHSGSEDRDVRLVTSPFVIDQTHPLGEGLDLEGVIWATPRDSLATEPGEIPIVVSDAGEIAVERRGAGEERTLRLALDPARSNILAHPSWPVLVWNALAWRDAARSGPARANALLGQVVTVRLAQDNARLIRPNGESSALHAPGGIASIDGASPGLHRVESGDRRFYFAVLPIAAAESDPASASTSEHGEWSAPDEGQAGVRSLAWLAALLALATLAVHAWLLERSAGGAP
jgi:hypothetical protein